MNEENGMMERYQLAIGRIEQIAKEPEICRPFCDYFCSVAQWLIRIEKVRVLLEQGQWQELTVEQMEEMNRKLYAEILPANYETSYANPSYAVEKLGEQGQLLSAVYAELRGAVAYIFEGRLDCLTILCELFLEIYQHFESESGEPESLRKSFYWYASDYSDVYLEDRILDQIDSERSFATDLIMNSDLSDPRFLYRYGEYVSHNERQTLAYLNTLPEETLQRMADVFTEGYRIGFVNTGKDLSIKSTVNIRYCLGFEPVVKRAIQNFEKMGLKTTIYRAAVSIVTKREQHKIGYYGAIANKQYEYDHRADQALILDKKYVERKLDVTKNVYERNKDLAAGFAGPACMEVFGEIPFSPEVNSEAPVLSEVQQELSRLYDSRSGQLVNQYIKGEERSFTIIAYPVPEIGEQYPEIFQEVIRINTLDAKVYEQVQQKIIDALDQGEYVHVLGKDANKTDMKVQLYRIQNPEKETVFENCVADVNIPVGEVFTSPVLEGTEGTLFVSKVFLHELLYQNLEIKFADGKIVSYRCDNFEDEAENLRYIKDNILHNHETLPLGEFAIGTNTTAYVAAKKYGIEDKMPILIAEKMGPHFAVGDTCYSWSEDIKVYNPNGKEIVARDNSISILRKEDIAKAYFQCHTDITIPYEELEEISVVTKDGKKIILLKDGRFVLAGTEILNEPLEEAGL